MMNNIQRVEKIKQLLQRAFSPTLLKVNDDSIFHHGHAEAKEGRGHFSITIAAKQFDNCPLVQSHRLIYTALDQLMQTDIHALSINIKKCQ